MFDLQTILLNLGLTIPELMRLVTAIAFVMGMTIVIKGIMLMKSVPPMGHSNPPITMKTVLTMIFVGAALLYLPTTIHVGTTTFWAEPMPYSYVNETGNEWRKLLSTIFNIVKLVGLIAVIRGLLLLITQSSQGQGEHHPIKRGVTHLIGGIFCMNIEWFLVTVFATLGAGVT